MWARIGGHVEVGRNAYLAPTLPKLCRVNPESDPSKGLGFRFRVSSLGLGLSVYKRVWGLGFRVWELGFRVSSSKLKLLTLNIKP